VRSALLEVKGVTRVQVSLEQGEVVVTHDPGAASVQDLVAAVNRAEGPSKYTATAKQPSDPGASGR
jgi:copper chaperone CopZ